MLSIAERTTLYAALALATAAAWAVTWMQMDAVSGFSPLAPQIWCSSSFGFGQAAASFVMWISMMTAMMLPSAAPTVEVFATIARRRQARHEPYAPAFVFAAGYCLAWSGFSIAAVLTLSQLDRAADLIPTLKNAGPLLAGAALLVAGLYQFSSAKAACLRGCRSPLFFVMSEWRDGLAGALLMGARHGMTCIGCCWAIMSLMFFFSVMDLRWAAALTVYAAAEKFLPGGDTIIAPAFGSAAILGGLALIGINMA